MGQLKGTTIKGALNRSVCTPVNLFWNHKLRKKAKLQSPDLSTQQKFQYKGSWHHR